MLTKRTTIIGLALTLPVLLVGGALMAEWSAEGLPADLGSTSDSPGALAPDSLATEVTTRQSTWALEDWSETQLIGEGRFPSARARDLATLLASYDVVVLGQVIGRNEVTDEEVERRFGGPIPGSKVSGPAPDDGSPKAGATPNPGAWMKAPVGTLYVVEVRSVVQGDVREFEQIEIFHVGWVREGTSHQLDADPAMVLGGEYVLFLNHAEALDWYQGSPFGRFRVDEAGRLSQVDAHWSRLGAVRELHGRRVADALVLLDQVARGP